MALVIGQRDTGKTAITGFDSKARDLEKDIYDVQPNRAPFTSFMMSLKSVPTKRTEFEHAEYTEIPGTVQVNGTINSGATALVVDSGHAARVPINAVLWSPDSDEMVYVSARDTSTDTLTITRGFASTTAAELTDNYVLTILEGYEEGVEFSEGATDTPSLKTNYVQEIETEISASWIQMAEAEETEADWDFQNERAFIRHKEKQERVFLFGKKNLGTGTQGKRIFRSGGIYQTVLANAAAANRKDLAGAVLTKDDLDVWAAQLRSYGNPNRKIWFTSPLGWVALTRLAEGYQTIEPSEKTLGMTIQKVAILGNVYTIVENQAFVNQNFSDLLLCVDMDHVRKRPFSWRGFNFTTKWHKEVQTNALKGRRDVVYSIEGIQVRIADAHGYVKNFALPS